jgi:hypothetical protein
MLYAIFCYNREAVIEGWTKEHDDAVMARHGEAMQRLAQRGKLGPVARLMPTRTAVTYRPGQETALTDGPFAETKEQLLGFYIVECASIEEAAEIAKPFAHEPGCLEIRPVQFYEPGVGLK